jgi:hypothetical protein
MRSLELQSIRMSNDWTSDLFTAAPEPDPLLSLRGSGKHLWADEHSDDCVRRLREGWDEPESYWDGARRG